MYAELSDPSAAAPAVPGDAACAGPLFVIINPGSGGQDAGQTRELLENVFGEAKRPAQFPRVAEPSMLAQVCDQAAAQARREGGVLVAVGGDGTINTAAQAAICHGCPLGVIPQGTFNFLAREHGIPLEPQAAARALVRAQPHPVQAGRVNGQLFLVNASLGLYPQLLQDREQFKSQLGRHRWVAVLSGLATVFKWRRQMTLEIERDGQRTTLRTATLFVANNRLQMERIGIEEEVAAAVGRGRLAGLVTRPIGSWSLLWLALRGALGMLGEAGQVRSVTLNRLEVKVRRMRRVKVATDGEVRVMASPIVFTVAPEPLLLMMPGDQDRVARE